MRRLKSRSIKITRSTVAGGPRPVRTSRSGSARPVYSTQGRTPIEQHIREAYRKL
ncbi:unnamed protein product [Penicillium roqueforti FM164]|uniref:Genomic scaffold, ProqFM164S01 n=1 Tax=Penicillium roqueforti (strain FM164) TaxID=1365484 RepID=W6QH66_PENRF|nr:unnamed protein product [Penicillium roqueforti FM164]